MVNLPKWVDLVNPNTKSGEEEYKFFISLARHPDQQWRSISVICKETGLSEDRVKEILVKYFKKGLIIQNNYNSTLWGYWESIPKDQLPKENLSIADKDKKDRIEKAIKSDYDPDIGAYDVIDNDFMKRVTKLNKIVKNLLKKK